MNEERIAELINVLESYLGILSDKETSGIAEVINLGFEVDAIIYTYNYHKDFQWVIFTLNGYYNAYKNTNTENIHSLIDSMVETRNIYGAVLQHINKPCSKQERETILEWAKNGFSADLINYAFDVCVKNTGVFNLTYVDKVLHNWRKWGLTTLEQVKESEIAYKARAQRKIAFKDENHMVRYHKILKKMATADVVHSAIAYLLAFDENISNRQERISECFDFKDDAINPDALRSAWVNENDRCVLTLVFNIWNSSYVANVSDIFLRDSENAEYFFEAVKIRLGLVEEYETKTEEPSKNDER